MLTSQQIAQYERDGFLVLRAQFDDVEIATFERAYPKQAWHTSGPPGKTYPEPARYTLARSCMADPDLAAIAEHPRVLDPVATLLGEDPILTAFVLYDRTPDGPAIPKHNDYKRWRPVGSSMHWLFAIVPFTDYDAAAGPLFVSPGSHRTDRVRDIGGRALHVDPPPAPDDESFVDPELKRGDLLLMNMHCWHRAGPNRSSRPRAGFFNKYAAKSFPPATGYYVFNDAAYEALSRHGRELVAVHSDKPVAVTRMLLQREGPGGPEFLLSRDDAGNLGLPGGPTFHEHAIPDWDFGNYVAAVHAAMREQVQVETPWATYVGDYDEGDVLSRVYAYEMSGHGFPASYRGEWLPACDALDGSFAQDYVAAAVTEWMRPGVTRGKAVSQAQARVDQYAY